MPWRHTISDPFVEVQSKQRGVEKLPFAHIAGMNISDGNSQFHFWADVFSCRWSSQKCDLGTTRQLKCCSGRLIVYGASPVHKLRPIFWVACNSLNSLSFGQDFENGQSATERLDSSSPSQWFWGLRGGKLLQILINSPISPFNTFGTALRPLHRPCLLFEVRRNLR